MTNTITTANQATTTTATVERILAIDLGKYKSVACDYRAMTSEVGFTTIDTSRAEMDKLLRKWQPDVVVIEACALAALEAGLCCSAF